MKTSRAPLVPTLLVATSAFAAIAAFAGSSDEQLQRDLGDEAIVGEWHYDDIAGGISAAKRSGRPLMVVFR